MKTESSEKRISHGRRIDFHTHILPEMDDGSRSVQMSIQMLEKSVSQGVSCVVLTPHFYASKSNPRRFFEKRKDRLEKLRSAYGCKTPQLLAGAEVQYFEGITAMQELSQMRIGNSPGLLIEMPMCTWSNRMLVDIAELNSRRDYQVILAHIERYLHGGNLRSIRQLAASGIMMQVSADIFRGFTSSRTALKLLDEGLVHILGSDCHNMSSRPPNLALAYELIERKRGEAAVKKIMDNGFRLLGTHRQDGRVASAKMEEAL